MNLDRLLNQARELLASRDPHTVRLGLDQVAASPAAIATLSDRLTLRRGRVHGPMTFVWTGHRDWVGLSLMAMAGALDGATELAPEGRMADMSALEGLTALERFSLRSAGGRIDLSGLAGLTGLRHLTLERCSALRDLSPLAGLTGLQTLRVTHSVLLSDLSPLAGLSALEALELTGCDAIRDLGALQGLTALKRLDLNGCARLERGWAMVAMGALEWADLRGCSGMKPRPELALIEGADAALTWRRRLARGLSRSRSRGAFEDALLAGAKAEGLLAKSAAEAERREARPTAAAIRRLLSSRTLDDARQGLELLIALDDPVVTADFAKGVSLDERGAPVVSEAVVRRAHLRNRERRGWVALAVLRASGELARHSTFQIGSPIHPIPDLMPFEDLESVVELRVRNTGRLSDLRPLESCANLEVLSIDSGSLIDDLSPIAGLPRLHTLRLMGTPRPLDLSPLAGSASLRVLDLKGIELTGLAQLAAMDGLEQVLLRRCHGLADLSPLKGLRGLVLLDLTGSDAPERLRKRYNQRNNVVGAQRKM